MGDGAVTPIPNLILSLDPGETTGWSLFTNGNMTDCGHVAGEVENMLRLINLHGPEIVVAEEYRVYAWKAKHHAWSRVQTVRLLGALELTCKVKKLGYVTQSAQYAKGFVTDAKLREWGYWLPNKRHAMDSIRHGCAYLLFGHKTQAKKEAQAAKSRTSKG